MDKIIIWENTDTIEDVDFEESVAVNARKKETGNEQADTGI
mgnify:FL=1